MFPDCVCPVCVYLILSWFHQQSLLSVFPCCDAILWGRLYIEICLDFGEAEMNTMDDWIKRLVDCSLASIGFIFIWECFPQVAMVYCGK